MSINKRSLLMYAGYIASGTNTALGYSSGHVLRQLVGVSNSFFFPSMEEGRKSSFYIYKKQTRKKISEDSLNFRVGDLVNIQR